MGVAGVALLWTVISLFKLIGVTVSFVFFKLSGFRTTAVVQELIDYQPKPNGDSVYVYVLSLQDEEGQQKCVTLSEKVAKNQHSCMSVEDTIPVIYDRGMNEAKAITPMKQAIKSSAISLLISVAIFLCCCFIAYAIS